MQESWNSLCLVFLQLWSSLNSSLIWPCRGTARAAKIGVAWQGTFYRFFWWSPDLPPSGDLRVCSSCVALLGMCEPTRLRIGRLSKLMKYALGLALPFSRSWCSLLRAMSQQSVYCLPMLRCLTALPTATVFFIGDKPAEAKVLSTKLMLTLPLGQRFDVSVESKREQLRSITVTSQVHHGVNAHPRGLP